ncbi:MAG: FAD-dependent oxidoreductase, partial [Deltaproteobacteria bacterium]|nr:FAD-dependent oxidoreductase [Deltaproteobacteria bacterium]
MEKFDVIVIGGGVAGLTAAYVLAGEGLETLVLERGDYAGAKNVTGGRIYLNPVRDFFPEIWAKAPLERGIAREELCMMSGHDSICVSFRDLDSGGGGGRAYQSYSVLRSVFD